MPGDASSISKGSGGPTATVLGQRQPHAPSTARGGVGQQTRGPACEREADVCETGSDGRNAGRAGPSWNLSSAPRDASAGADCVWIGRWCRHRHALWTTIPFHQVDGSGGKATAGSTPPVPQAFESAGNRHRSPVFAVPRGAPLTPGGEGENQMEVSSSVKHEAPPSRECHPWAFGAKGSHSRPEDTQRSAFGCRPPRPAARSHFHPLCGLQLKAGERKGGEGEKKKKTEKKKGRGGPPHGTPRPSTTAHRPFHPALRQPGKAGQAGHRGTPHGWLVPAERGGGTTTARLCRHRALGTGEKTQQACLHLPATAQSSARLAGSSLRPEKKDELPPTSPTRVTGPSGTRESHRRLETPGRLPPAYTGSNLRRHWASSGNRAKEKPPRRVGQRRPPFPQPRAFECRQPPPAFALPRGIGLSTSQQ